MITIAGFLDILDRWAPPALAMERDNIGLLVGSPDTAVTRCLVCLDVTKEVVEEAVTLGVNLIVAHHPFIYHPLRTVRTDRPIGRVLQLLLERNIGVIASHTNADFAPEGLNTALAAIFELQNARPLVPAKDSRRKLVAHIRQDGAPLDSLRKYLSSTPNLQWFTADYENGVSRLEIILSSWMNREVMDNVRLAAGESLLMCHAVPLLGGTAGAGSGVIGMLPEAIPAQEFLFRVKDELGTRYLRTTPYDPVRAVERIAICSGSGGGLIEAAISAKADLFLTADLTYHHFQDYRAEILLVDAGHFETEYPFIHECARRLKEAFQRADADIDVLPTGAGYNPIRFV